MPQALVELALALCLGPRRTRPGPLFRRPLFRPSSNSPWRFPGGSYSPWRGASSTATGLALKRRPLFRRPLLLGITELVYGDRPCFQKAPSV